MFIFLLLYFWSKCLKVVSADRLAHHRTAISFSRRDPKCRACIYGRVARRCPACLTSAAIKNGSIENAVATVGILPSVPGTLHSDRPIIYLLFYVKYIILFQLLLLHFMDKFILGTLISARGHSNSNTVHHVLGEKNQPQSWIRMSMIRSFFTTSKVFYLLFIISQFKIHV